VTESWHISLDAPESDLPTYREAALSLLNKGHLNIHFFGDAVKPADEPGPIVPCQQPRPGDPKLWGGTYEFIANGGFGGTEKDATW
jgi:hypothetical protein